MSNPYDSPPPAPAPGVYDPSADQAACTAAGYFYCTIENKCLPTTLHQAADIQAQGQATAAAVNINSKPTTHGGGSCPPHTIKIATCKSECGAPQFWYESLTNLTEQGRLCMLRGAYADQQACYAKRISPKCSGGLNDENRRIMEDELAGVTQSLLTVNNALLDLNDGVPTNPTELMTTFLGDTRDELSKSTRRTRPLGTIITEMDGFYDNITVIDIPANDTFDTNVIDDIPLPDFTGIDYVPSAKADAEEIDAILRKLLDFKKDENKDLYDEEHETCLDELPCTFDEFKIENAELPDLDLEDQDAIDVEIDDGDITSGCANGDGLYDKLMTAIDSSIDMQWKNSRLDNKTFGQFYAGAMSSAMTQTTQFLIQKEQLKLDAERVKLLAEKQELDKITKKYDIALTVAQTAKIILETKFLQKRIPLELAKLTQETKLAEKQVEFTTKQIEAAEAGTLGTYNTIAETRVGNSYERARIKATTQQLTQTTAETILNGESQRNLEAAQLEQTRVQTKTGKYDTLLKKYQAFNTKVQTAESKATGAANRRVMGAEVQTKVKMASLYDQQRKTFVYGSRLDVLKVMKDLWQVQIDTLGAEGMAIEVIKGPEFGTKLERASLDVGL